VDNFVEKKAKLPINEREVNKKMLDIKIEQ
jgi:hypothetical protein